MSESETWRLFVALPIPTTVTQSLVALQSDLRNELPDAPIRWVKPRNFHLTVRFLGDVETSELAEIEGRMSVIAKSTAALALVAERIGFFPSDRFPRTIWAWVHDQPQGLQNLAKALREDLVSFGDAAGDTSFTGHITIGRCRRITRAEKTRLAGLARQYVIRRFGKWLADEMVLMRSQLDHNGSIYSQIRRFQFTGSRLKFDNEGDNGIE